MSLSKKASKPSQAAGFAKGTGSHQQSELFNFLGLPPEMRNMIYQLVVKDWCETWCNSDRFHDTMLFSDLPDSLKELLGATRQGSGPEQLEEHFPPGFKLSRSGIPLPFPTSYAAQHPLTLTCSTIQREALSMFINSFFEETGSSYASKPKRSLNSELSPLILIFNKKAKYPLPSITYDDMINRKWVLQGGRYAGFFRNISFVVRWPHVSTLAIQKDGIKVRAGADTLSVAVGGAGTPTPKTPRSMTETEITKVYGSKFSRFRCMVEDKAEANKGRGFGVEDFLDMVEFWECEDPTSWQAGWVNGGLSAKADWRKSNRGQVKSWQEVLHDSEGVVARHASFF